jgi:hypothetical protein
MKNYTIYCHNDTWYLVDAQTDMIMQYSYFDDLLEYLASKESEERS